MTPEQEDEPIVSRLMRQNADLRAQLAQSTPRDAQSAWKLVDQLVEQTRELRQQLAQTQQALRVRDEEIGRLRMVLQSARETIFKAKVRDFSDLTAAELEESQNNTAEEHGAELEKIDKLLAAPPIEPEVPKPDHNCRSEKMVSHKPAPPAEFSQRERESEGKEKPTCAEQWDEIPFTSEHLFQGGLRGEPMGKCSKCGKCWSDYGDEMTRRAIEKQRPASATPPGCRHPRV